MSESLFAQIVSQYTKLIFSVCYRFVDDYYEAENLTQETFITAYRAIDNFVGDNYKSWLVKIAVNKCKDYLKSAYVRKTSPVENQTLELMADRSIPELEYEQKESIEFIKASCENLKSPYKEVALLHFIEDKSFEEISILLDRPVKTVQTQCYRARDKLKKIVKEEIGSA